MSIAAGPALAAVCRPCEAALSFVWGSHAFLRMQPAVAVSGEFDVRADDGRMVHAYEAGDPRVPTTPSNAPARSSKSGRRTHQVSETSAANLDRGIIGRKFDT
jgi:hypothetical protein